ncbi:MAG: hypothetical protein J1E85_00560 [Ruminococcus sp.]|nr:hypothetical protein [Ruminococcus sp.]
MKKFKAIFAVVLAAMCVCMFAGCDKSESINEPTESTEHIEVTGEAENKDFDLKSLHSFDLKNGNEFAGAWKITAGTGSKLDNFVYIFDGKSSANLVVGTTGYCGKYALDKTEKTFTCQLMFGINGQYTYEKNSDDEIVLTNIESKETTTLSRIASFDMVPIPMQNAKIDNAILGAWKSENGEYYYFDKSGIMYQNQYGTMFTYYKYSAKDGTITAVSNMGEAEDQTETFEYTVTDEELIIDGYEYIKTSTDDLI